MEGTDSALRSLSSPLRSDVNPRAEVGGQAFSSSGYYFTCHYQLHRIPAHTGSGRTCERGSEEMLVLYGLLPCSCGLGLFSPLRTSREPVHVHPASPRRLQTAKEAAAPRLARPSDHQRTPRRNFAVSRPQLLPFLISSEVLGPFIRSPSASHQNHPRSRTLQAEPKHISPVVIQSKRCTLALIESRGGGRPPHLLFIIRR